MYVLLSQRIRHSYCSDLLKFIPNQRIPQAVPWLQEFSRKRKLTLASACLKPIYQPFRYKKYPQLQLSDRPVAYGQEQKIPRNKFYQIV